MTARKMLLRVILTIGVVLGGCFLAFFVMGPGGQTKEQRAKMDVKSLEGVVEIYYTKHGYYPNTLEELLHRDPVENTPAPLTEAGLLDPWRQPYNYDPNKLSPEGKPLIWSDGPPGENKPIRNWGP